MRRCGLRVRASRSARSIRPCNRPETKIRNRNIHTERCFFGKTHSRINDNHFVARTDSHTIHPEFADAAQRYYFYFAHNNFITHFFYDNVTIINTNSIFLEISEFENLTNTQIFC